MHSSCKVIKGFHACEKGNVSIETTVPVQKVQEVNNNLVFDGRSEEYDLAKLRVKEMLDRAEADAKQIMDEVLKEKETILYEAKEAGFKQGYEEGYNIGFNEGKDSGYNEGSQEGQAIIDNANYILYQAKEEYDKFLKEKEMNIRKIIISSVESMLKKEFENEAALDNLLFQILSDEKSNKMFLIRVSSSYVSHLNSIIDEFKLTIGIKGEVIILEDNRLEEGTLVVEKDNGKTSFTIENSIDKLREVLMEV